jgi:hypothetical protein
MRKAKPFRFAGNLNYTVGCQQADALRDSVSRRLGIRPNEIQCPRECSQFALCAARDGGLAVGLDSAENALCVGCDGYVASLLASEEIMAGRKLR